MRLARFTVEGHTRLGAVLGDQVADLTASDASLPPDVGELLAAGRLGEVERTARRAPRRRLDAVKLEAPIRQPPSFLAVGLNYREHADETGLGTGGPPAVFNKQVTCVTGPVDPIEIPAAAPDQVDYEGELGIVIGRRCRAVPAAQAPGAVAGYVVVNDVSVRDWQFAAPTWTMGKGWDTHGPTGPWLVTTDEVPDPQALRLRTWVDGELRQNASTAEMIHSCWNLIAYLSTAFTLLPGTIIATGTPAGVGFAMDPPRYLRPGERVRVEVEGIGALDNPVVGPVAGPVVSP